MNIDLTKYCEAGGVREYLRRPFNLGDRVVATNGHIAVSVPTYENDFDDAQERVAKTLNEFFSFEPEYINLKLQIPEKDVCPDCQGTKKSKFKICPECDGDGGMDFETDYNYYDVECKSCRGRGKVKTDKSNEKCEHCNGEGVRWLDSQYVLVDDIRIQPIYAEMLLEFPDLLVKGIKEKNLILFKSGQIKGALMGLCLADNLAHKE